MKLRKICEDCQGRKECAKATEANWRDCKGKSYFKESRSKGAIYNPKLKKILEKNSEEV